MNEDVENGVLDETVVPSYSYDVSKIRAGGKDQMRLELGDTAVEGGAETCVLCDAEYSVLIENERGSWRRAKIACLNAIVARLAYEVDYSADGVSLSLSHRYGRFLKMLERELKGRRFPTANAEALGKGKSDGGHYFTLGMMNNPEAAGSEGQ